MDLCIPVQEEVVHLPMVCRHKQARIQAAPQRLGSSTEKKRKKSKDKLPENLGVISVMGAILMWAKSSAVLDPPPNILMYQRKVFQNDGEILSFCLITAKRITMFSNPTLAQEISMV